MRYKVKSKNSKVKRKRVQRNLHWRLWVPAIGRNKTQQGVRVPLGTKYWTGWLPVVVWMRIYRMKGLTEWMQARHGICRGLTSGTDHNKSGPKYIWNPALRSAHERHRLFSTRCTKAWGYQRALHSTHFDTVMRLIWWKMELMLRLFNTYWGTTMYGPLSVTHMWARRKSTTLKVRWTGHFDSKMKMKMRSKNLSEKPAQFKLRKSHAIQIAQVTGSLTPCFSSNKNHPNFGTCVY
jgi:hypothetical protein